MKRILKEEIGRAVKGRGMIMALVIGCIISLAHVIQYLIPANQTNLTMDFVKSPIIYPLIVSSGWLAGEPSNLESFVYFLVLPIIATLPFGTSYFSDRQSGYLKNLYMRTSRKQLLCSKYASAFLSGGIAVVLPLILNLAFALVLLPNLLPNKILPQNIICGRNVFFELYFGYPLVYILIFLCIDFIFGGIFSCIALACSFISDYKVIVAICPFFIQLIIHVVCTMLGAFDYSSVYFVQSGYGITNLWVVGIYVVAGILVSFIIFMRKGEKENVF